MTKSEAIVKLALKMLNCSQKDLAARLSVSPAQVSKWAKNDEYMSPKIEEQLRAILNLGQMPEKLILNAGSVENAQKWEAVFKYLAELVLDSSETGYDSYRLVDYEDNGITASISEILHEMGVNLSNDAPTPGDDGFHDNSTIVLIESIFDSTLILK